MIKNDRSIRVQPRYTPVRSTGRDKKNERRQIGLLALTMLGLGGAIGSGIFVACGIPISLAGPGVILAFLIGGMITMSEFMMLAEMGVARPVSGSFSIYAEDYLGRAMGFISGWLYWTSGILTLSTEMVAAALIARSWLPSWPIWLLSLMIALLISGISLLDVRAFARVEEGLSFIKVGVLIFTIILGTVFLTGLMPGFQSPGLNNYFSQGGLFPHGWSGFLASMLLVMYTYAGGQVIGMAVGDTKNPTRTVPRAVMMINLTLLLLYLGSISILLGMVPWNEVPQNGSGFAPLFQRFGIPGIAVLMNAVIFSAILSAMNSNLYGVPRMLGSLAERKDAPVFLAKLDKRGVPVPAVLASSLFLLLVAGISYFVPERIFVYVASASGVTILLNWVIIAATHLKFRLHHNNTGETGTTVHSGYPLFTLVTIILLLAVIATAAFNSSQSIGLITGLFLFSIYGGLHYLLRHFQKTKPDLEKKPAKDRLLK